MKVLMINKFLFKNGGSESYVFRLGNYLKIKTKKFASGAIRTRDLSLKRGVLYLLSYRRKLFNLLY